MYALLLCTALSIRYATAQFSDPPPPPPPYTFSCSADTTVEDIARPLNLSSKVVVVTGADGRSGSAVVLSAAMAGARVVLVGRNASRLGATVKATATKVPSARLSTSVFDLASLNSTRAGAAQLLKDHPRIDVLVNNAGGDIGGMTNDGYATMFQVNNIAPALLTHLLLPALQAAGTSGAPPSLSRVINVASAAAFDPLPLEHSAAAMMDWARGSPHELSGGIGYGVSKFLVIEYTSSLDQWLRAPGQMLPINALSVNPGYFRTPPFTLADKLACDTVMLVRPGPQLPEQGAAAIAFAALDDEALSAPDGKRMIDFETRHLGPVWSQHGDNCVPRKAPVHSGWEAKEAGAWFRLVQEAIGAV
jgi:NAD(P)-dependent dehydrogenase (short-subunit alcohol dehydrogenase family)